MLSAMSELGAWGRRVRVAGAVGGLVLLGAGTVWGLDDDFPFGPFRMFSTAPGPDEAARDTRVEGVERGGRVVALDEANTGIRRAEIEGQMAGYAAQPSRLGEIATAYAEHTPGAAALAEVRIVIRWHEVHDSRPTGTSRDEVVAEWELPA